MELHDAVQRRDNIKVEELLKAGADVNARDEEGYTPLHVACINNNAWTAGVLLDVGADVNAKDNNGYTPAALAEVLHKQLVEILGAHWQINNEENMEKSRIEKFFDGEGPGNTEEEAWNSAVERYNNFQELETANPALIHEMAAVTVDPAEAEQEEAEWQRQYNQPRQSEPENGQETPDPENPEVLDQGNDQDNSYTTPGLRPGL